MPQLARGQTKVTARSKVIRWAQESFSRGELVRGILHFLPIEFRLHIDAMGAVERVAVPVFTGDSAHEFFTEQNVGIRDDDDVTCRAAQGSILCGHLVKRHLRIQRVLTMDFRWNDHSSCIGHTTHEFL